MLISGRRDKPSMLSVPKLAFGFVGNASDSVERITLTCACAAEGSKTAKVSNAKIVNRVKARHQLNAC